MDSHANRRFGFMAKAAGMVALVALADALVFGERGPILGSMALAWIAMLIAAVPAVRRDRGARWALGASAAFGIVLVDDPSLLAWTLFWIALSMAAMLPRRRFDDALRWAQRLGLHALLGLVQPVIDVRRLCRVRRGGDRIGLRSIASVAALPLIGGSVFLALFAGANPLISGAFARLQLPSPAWAALHLLLWLGVALAIWPSLRPHRCALRLGRDRRAAPPRLPDVPLATLTPSLVTFNAIFALQNGLDLIFLWSGAPLPATITLADYAHRGAYTLIATALLAGLFVLTALRPESPGARSPLVRRLLVLWVAQNLLLVASSILRLFDYIDAYSLTILRLSALAWMALVAIGLVLICWRLLAGRSAAWLINANALAAAMVLAAASVIDLGATAAAWNVRHARTARDLDLCYLAQLGPSALLPLVALERRVAGARLRDRVAFVRGRALFEAEAAQADPRTWSWRNARRLDAARAALGAAPRRPGPAPNGRACDGSPFPPAPIEAPAVPAAPAPPPARPLTAETKQ